MFDKTEQMIISLHSFVGTERARGTALSPLETDSEQSHMQRVGASAQIHTHTHTHTHTHKIISHIATQQENAEQLQKEGELQDMRI